MTIQEIEVIVAQTLNILERDLGIEELSNFGRPTIEEIARQIAEQKAVSA